MRAFISLRKTFSGICLFLLLVMAPSLALGDIVSSSHDKDSIKLGLSGTLSFLSNSEDDEDLTTWIIFANGGYFFADNLEGSFHLGGFTTDADVTLLNWLAQGKYYLPVHPTMAPYGGVQMGFTSAEFGAFNDTGFAIGFMLGNDFMISESLSFSLEYNFLASFVSAGQTDITLYHNQFLYGLNYHF